MRVSPVMLFAVIVAAAAPVRAQATATFPDAAPSAPAADVTPMSEPAPPAYSVPAQPSVPSTARFDQPARDDYAIEEHTPAAPLVVGSLLIGVPYATGLGIAAAEGFANGSGWLAVPALGPWIALSAREDPCDSAKQAQEFTSEVGECVAEPFVRGMLVLDGVLQATGAIVLFVGLNGKDERFVPSQSRARVAMLPRAFGKNGYGLGLHGSF